MGAPAGRLPDEMSSFAVGSKATKRKTKSYTVRSIDVIKRNNAVGVTDVGCEGQER